MAAAAPACSLEVGYRLLQAAEAVVIGQQRSEVLPVVGSSS